ncbi:MAG: glycosyltransferase [Acidobacteriota bacterium]|nr:MAG: glycosyltransferase [Acidobacteriota bacterium]
MITVFVIAAILLLLQSLMALAAGLRLAGYVGRMRLLRQNRYQPKAVVIVPCKGLDHGIEENLRALLSQEYREFEVIFVTESEKDPAYGLISKIIRQSRRAAWMVTAGEAKDRGQKVHNLIAALEMLGTIDRRAEVLVFADSDARPGRHWLSELVAPLGDKRIGATTGFRWFLPDRKAGLSGTRFASILLSVWNSSALSLLGERSGFAWGGSMAIRRENFEKLEIRQRWQRAVSDDYVLAETIREAGQRIKFVPMCLVASPVRTSPRELLEFTTRQMRITRVYAPRIWKLAFLTHGFYNLTFWGGLICLAIARAYGMGTSALPVLLMSIFLLGAAAGGMRAVLAIRMLPGYKEMISRDLWAHALLSPITSLLYLCNLTASAMSRRITWRGIQYELVSFRETVILQRPRPSPATDPFLRADRRKKASVRSSTRK